MSDLIAITGNLTSPPTRHDVAGGIAMVTFGLASTERRFENGTWRDVHTNFYNVSVFRKLAEHAYASLEKGQRVILSGKLKVRHWEANGRTGTSVDLEATSIGPDLMFGVATFVKDGRAAESSGNGPDARAAAPDEWAQSTDVDHATGELVEPSDSGFATSGGGDATGDDARADERSLVAAGGWGAPSQSEEAPF